jgi:hypothetical protein
VESRAAISTQIGQLAGSERIAASSHKTPGSPPKRKHFGSLCSAITTSSTFANQGTDW